MTESKFIIRFFEIAFQPFFKKSTLLSIKYLKLNAHLGNKQQRYKVLIKINNNVLVAM
jgi:hypothetical protein